MVAASVAGVMSETTVTPVIEGAELEMVTDAEVTSSPSVVPSFGVALTVITSSREWSAAARVVPVAPEIAVPSAYH